MASSSDDTAVAEVQKNERKLEDAKKKKAELETDLAKSEKEVNALLSTLDGIDRFMPEKLTKYDMPPKYRAMDSWTDVYVMRYGSKMSTQYEDDESWEKDPEWDDEQRQLLASGSSQADSKPTLKDRFNRLCGKKQDAVYALAKETNDEAKTELAKRIEDLDAKIDRVRRKRQKRKEAESDDEDDADADDHDEEGEDDDDDSSDDDSDSTDDDSTDDENGEEKKTWFARDEESDLKRRMTKSEAEKIRTELRKRAAPVEEQAKQATVKKMKIAEELTAVVKEIASLTSPS